MATEETINGVLQDESEQNEQTTLAKSEILKNLESQESYLASLLCECTDNDLERDSDILQHMGVVYHLRGLKTKQSTDFVKSSALFNSALIRTKIAEKAETLRILNEMNENVFLRKIAKIEAKILPTTLTSIMQEKIKSLREDVEKRLKEAWRLTKVNFSIQAAKQVRIEEEKNLVKRIKSLSMFTSLRMKLLFKDMLNECYRILGPAPQKFAVIGLGSLAREEVTPYSDLEFIILLEDDKQDTAYFRNLTYLFQLLVLNLGETPLPAIGIKSLNDFDSKSGSWFYDSVTTNGICFDGAMPWACKTPTGRPDREHKAGVELIKTPTNMAKYIEHEFALKEGYHIAEMLRTTTLIDGCSKLLEDFNSLCSSLGNDTDIKYYGLNTLRQDAKQFGKNSLLDKLVNRMSPEIFQSIIAMQHVKREIYRLPSILTNNLKLIYNLSKNSPWDLVEEMTGSFLSDEDSLNLQVATSIAVLFRLKTYMTNKGQKEKLTFLKQSGAANFLQKDEIATYSCDNKQLIFRFYFTVVPLLNTLLSSHWGTHSIDYLSQSLKNLYDDNYRIQGHLHSFFLSHTEAVGCYTKALQTENSFLPQEKAYLMGDLSMTYYQLGSYDNALHWRKQSLQIWSNTLCGSEGVSGALSDMGSMHYQKGEFDEALLCFKRALDTEKSVTNKGMYHERNTANLLANIGAIHQTLGNYEDSLSTQLEALQIQKQIQGDGIDCSIPITLDNIGTVLMLSGDYDKAASYHEEALRTRKQIYGRSVHPDLASSLGNMASVYRERHDYDKALSYNQEALQMIKQIHGDRDHPEVAMSLHSIALTYFHRAEYDNARFYQVQSLPMIKRVFLVNDPQRVVTSLMLNAKLYKVQGDIDNFNKCMQEAADIAKQRQLLPKC